MAQNARSYTAGRFALDIDGNNAGFLKKFSGLSMEADLATHDLGPDNVQKKNVTRVKWAPGNISIGIGMGNDVYQWMKSAFDKNYIRKNGSIVAADFNYKAQQRLDFYEALITSITIPVLEGQSKESAYFDVAFDAERVEWKSAGGEDIRGKIGPKQKAWLCGAYRVEIGNLPCNGVSKVAGGDGKGMTWSCSVVADEIGTTREPTKVPAKVSVPDITLTVSGKDHQQWADAAKKFLVDGNSLESDEMTGRIVFLSPNLKEEIGELELMNVGFKSFKHFTLEANSENIARFDVTLYVEQMKFKIKEYDL